MGTRSGCEAGSSAPAAPTSGGQDLPARTSLAPGEVGADDGGRVRGSRKSVSQLSHPRCCPSRWAKPPDFGPRGSEEFNFEFLTRQLKFKVFGKKLKTNGSASGWKASA